MSTDNAARAKRLVLAREFAGFKNPSEAARALGVKLQTYFAHENGNRGFLRAAEHYAKRFGVEYAWLATNTGPMRKQTEDQAKKTHATSGKMPKTIVNVRVVGAVQAGVWAQASTWSVDDQYETLVRLNPRYNGLEPVAFEVRGPSMNRAYPHGTVVICVRYIELGRPPIHGERVIVQRQRGAEYEASVKEYRRDPDGIARLWPLSTHPDHQAPIRADDTDEVTITHKVISAQIDEP